MILARRCGFQKSDTVKEFNTTYIHAPSRIFLVRIWVIDEEPWFPFPRVRFGRLDSWDDVNQCLPHLHARRGV